MLGVEELGESDRVAVARARKAQRPFTQPFFVAEVFTRVPGRFAPARAAVRDFGALLRGRLDGLDEGALFFAGLAG